MTPSTPLVSIIVPSYNHAAYLEKRLSTIINQTFTDFKIIIIDDCSTDGSLKILENFRRQYPQLISHFIVNDKNSGSGYLSWKKGIELAQSEYIWIAETDDFSEPEFLEKMVAVLENHPEVALVFCSNYVVDQENKVISNSDRRTSRLGVKEGEAAIFGLGTFIGNMPFKTFITNGSSVVFRKSSQEIPSDFFSYRQMTDAFLWTYLIGNQKFAFLNEKLNSFRRHAGATTVRMYKDHVKEVFLEKADYLNYFGLTDKYKVFVTEYLRMYVWHNKSKCLDFEVINRVKNVPYKKIAYIKMLCSFFVKKSLSKIFKNKKS